MKKGLIALSLATVASSSFATLITFEDLSTGTVLSNQYSGVTFSGGIGSALGLTAPTGDWATNTDLTVVSSTGSDVGGLGTPSGLVSGNIIRSFNGWLSEDGDAAVTLTFATNITDISVAFAGIATAPSTGIYAIKSDNTIFSSAVASASGQTVLSLAGLTGINRVVITTGDFFDWVGFDNINYTNESAVPEPASMAVLGLGAVALMRRRRNK
ncbi:MAG TPA: PEP-CTERM sorting domain-containing protein [Fimbriimonas sp.]|nr:PEP-CTERM sorting domain-containing protein [Fimbriimonas sp.]